jgi:GntR family transcriptional regulator
VTDFQVRITTGSGTPIYRQIVDQVRLAVATGALTAGAAITVAKAYAELVRDGALDSQQGLGFFVARKRQVYSKAERLRRLRRAAEDFVNEAVFLDFTADEIRKAVDDRLAELDRVAKPTGA